MQFNLLNLAIFSTLTSFVLGADSFGIVAIHSGTQFQYAQINKVDSAPEYFRVGGSEGRPLSYTLQNDGTLLDSEGKHIRLYEPTLSFGEANPGLSPTKGFSIIDNHLVFNGQNSWKACPFENGKYNVLVFAARASDCSGGTGIELLVSKNPPDNCH